jgi:hypothetical protein
MHADRIEFISEYCDRWCERCAFTTRCSAYAVHAALGMCEGDFQAALELAVGAATVPGEAERRTARGLLADYDPTEQELAAVDRELEERDERIDESPLTTDTLVFATLAHQCLQELRTSLEDHDDRNVRQALEIASWDSHLIGAKVRRALDGQDEAQHGARFEEHPIQNDWNGSAKVALISIDRSIPAWNTIAATTAHAGAALIAQRLQALRVDVDRTFPNARKFVRPGFDDGGQSNPR